MKNVLDLISKIGKQESEIIEKIFISPVFSNTVVATHIDGITYSFKIPKAKDGWYRIQPSDTKMAHIVGEAELIDREKYLKHLNKLRLVLVTRKDGVYYGVPDKANKFGFKVNDLLPVFLCDDTPLDFDRIIARYDGGNIWFECVDQGNDPAKADYLRTYMAKAIDPEKSPFLAVFPGLTFEEKLAYTLRLTLDKKLVIDTQKDKLKRDVEFAGGFFVKFTERKDHFSVTYRVSGNEYTSYVSKDPVHSVISAGLCLSGTDRKFDLKSLVTVIREGQQKGLIHHHHLRA